MYGVASKAISYAAVKTVSLGGKKVVVVGGTSGLGQAIATAAAAKGAATTVVGRTFKAAGVSGVSFEKADLSRMSEAARIGRALPADLDVVVLTTGILAASTRQESPEGIELDMAVSALSRHVLLKELYPRLRPTARVFVMGMPGSGQVGVLGDLNWERSYDGGLGKVHTNTVAANEAIVHHWAAAGGAAGARIFGLNPGLIHTGIRTSVHGGGVLGGLMERVIDWMNPTPQQYADRILQLFLAPELAAHSGALFGQKGTAILPTSVFTDPAYTARWIAELDALASKALAHPSAVAALAAAPASISAAAGSGTAAAGGAGTSSPAALA